MNNERMSQEEIKSMMFKFIQGLEAEVKEPKKTITNNRDMVSKFTQGLTAEENVVIEVKTVEEVKEMKAIEGDWITKHDYEMMDLINRINTNKKRRY